MGFLTITITRDKYNHPKFPILSIRQLRMKSLNEEIGLLLYIAKHFSFLLLKDISKMFGF